MMRIEGGCRFIQGINDQRIGRDFGAQDPRQRIGQQRPPNP